jgi:aminomethyltransferase
MSDPPSLRTSPLDAIHRAQHAKMVPYAGWTMPLEYSGIAAEHLAVRTRAGIFDVSHMGEIEIAGKGALAAVQRVSCNDASALKVGQAQYSALLTPAGTFIDDVLVYRMAGSHFLLVANAANVAKDYAWIAEQAKAAGDAAVVDSSSRYALISLQGPASQSILQPLTGADLGDLGYYWFTHGEVANARAMISRTGYTGEDGFEIFVPPAMAAQVWTALLQRGREVGILACGLGARDTLRLEAALRLYGNDIDESTNALEAGLGWIVAWQKPEGSIGIDALRTLKEAGLARRLVGFEMIDRGIARTGCEVREKPGGAGVGVVTSGTQTPHLKKAIGMAYVPSALAASGTNLTIDIRGREAAARVVPLPFYKRPTR